MEGTLANSNSISLELHRISGNSTICFIAKASNGTKTVNVIGSYDSGKSISSGVCIHFLYQIINDNIASADQHAYADHHADPSLYQMIFIITIGTGAVISLILIVTLCTYSYFRRQKKGYGFCSNVKHICLIFTHISNYKQMSLLVRWI